MYDKSVSLLSKAHDFLIKSSPSPSNELINACDYLGLKKGMAHNIVKASLISSLISLIPALALFLLIKNPWVFFAPIIVNHFYSDYYKSKYYIKRVADFGSLPDFFSVLITNLKINPNLESALANASSLDYGMSSKIAKRIMKKISSGVDIDAKDELRKEFRAFNDSKVDLCINSIVSAISVKSQIKRNLLFTDSLNQLLNSMKNNAELFSRRIYSSVLMIFAIGTIIPLVLVSIFPLMSLINGKFVDAYSLFFFLIASVLIVAFISNDLKKKSPSKFSQIIIKSKPKALNPFLVLILIAGFSMPSILLLLEKFLEFKAMVFFREYSAFFFYASASIILSAYFFLKNRDIAKDKKIVQSIEESVIDSFMVIGARINEGHSIESSIKHAVDNSKGHLKEFFFKIYERISKFGFDLADSFNASIFSSKIFSKRVKSLSDLLCFTVKKHSVSAGEAMIEICDYYRRIRGVEFDMDNSLSKNTDMIKMTVFFFSPIVCALIINISVLINSFLLDSGGGMFFSFSSIDAELLGLMISSYLLVLIFVLSNFYSFLKFGDDGVESELNLSKSLIFALFAFTATLIISKIFFFKL
ncbi:MAG: hypothetical protein PHT91_01035 [Candidatus Nanoarchaeia archaeon]|nr:hypothetical protein [Candidatus Nanoarchaeia archaeon]MDD5499444.1 hypothetical protein [Candidatus Nanoarchaeia archaeon]